MRLLMLLAAGVVSGAPLQKTKPDPIPRVHIDPDRVVEANVRAAAVTYRAAVLEQMHVFEVVDRIAQRFTAGELAVSKATATKLHRWVEAEPERLTSDDRRRLYAHVLGTDGQEFSRRLWALLEVVAHDGSKGKPLPGSKSAPTVAPAVTPAVTQAAHELALHLTHRCYGAPVQLAPGLEAQLQQADAILTDPKIQAAYGAKGKWHLLRIVAGDALGPEIRVGRARARAEAGPVVIDWVARITAPGGIEGGADPEEVSPTERRVSRALRTLERTVTRADLEQRPAGTSEVELRPLCLDPKRRLVPCVVED